MIAARIANRLKLLACATIPALIAACGEPPQEVPQAASFVAQDIATLELSNPSQFARVDESVLLSLGELGIAAPADVALAVTEGSSVLPSHLIDTDGDGAQDALLFVADFEAAERRTFDIRTAPDAAAVGRGRVGWQDLPGRHVRQCRCR